LSHRIHGAAEEDRSNLRIVKALSPILESPLRRPPGRPPNCLANRPVHCLRGSFPDCFPSCPVRCSPYSLVGCCAGNSDDCLLSCAEDCSGRCGPGCRPRCSPRCPGGCPLSSLENCGPSCFPNCFVHCFHGCLRRREGGGEPGSRRRSPCSPLGQRARPLDTLGATESKRGADDRAPLRPEVG